MKRDEGVAHLRIGQQERPEFLRKDVARTDGIPDIVRHLVPFRRRRRNVAEVAIGEVVDLVVVVKDDATVAGDAEILEQQVAGKDIDRRQLSQRFAIVAHRANPRGVVGMREKKIERRQPPLDVHMANDDPAAVILDLRGRNGFQLREKLRREPVERKRDVGILENVGHSARAVVMLDERVFLFDGGAIGIFRCGDAVANHLEHVGIRGQREDRHHESLDAGCDDKTVGRVLQMVQEIAEEQRLSVFLQPDHRIELGRRSVRHDLAQECDVSRRHLHVDQKIGAIGREEQREVHRVGQQRIDDETSAGVVLDRDNERIPRAAVDQPPDRVRRLVAEKQR